MERMTKEQYNYPANRISVVESNPDYDHFVFGHNNKDFVAFRFRNMTVRDSVLNDFSNKSLEDNFNLTGRNDTLIRWQISDNILLFYFQNRTSHTFDMGVQNA